ncbi:MAG: hypothetical protein GX774_02830, partial [Armatimonadetes bacterium]|nr:hypothetical protein [Armatimonadota bacterium]
MSRDPGFRGHCHRWRVTVRRVAVVGVWVGLLCLAATGGRATPQTAAELPVGPAPAPVPSPHFPDRLHAYVWRNWQLVPLARLARVVGARPSDLRRLGKAMGLPDPPRITADQQRRSYLTVIRRNWHLLPYEQLLDLLGWTPAEMAYALREDDFLFIKLGSLKPRCEPLRYAPPEEAARAQAAAIARVVREEFPEGLGRSRDPLFGFVRQLTRKPAGARREPAPPSRFSPRYCYSYFALYGDPLLDTSVDPFPDGYLARLAESGVDGVWLQGVLHKLAPFPWDPALSAGHEERLRNLAKLVARARRHGIGVWLYLNEPRALPLSFFAAHPELRGTAQGDHAALCTSHPAVQRYLTEAVATVCRAVPDLAGLFTITASENFTHCWSHGGGGGCPRCSQRDPAAVIAEVNALFHEGIRQTDSPARLTAWDWGWADAWVEGILARLPAEVALMSVSEWSLPIRRGGIESAVGEYSISAVGPGPRASRHWELARRSGRKCLAKVQAGNTWELSAVPYIPAVENVAQHALNLREAGVEGLMLSWTLGGYPSPNLEVIAEVGRADAPAATAVEAMTRVARRRFGAALAPAVVRAWQQLSAAFREFPYHGGLVYTAPMQVGPANPLWLQPTGYRATMVGFPYDDLDAWRAVYPPEVFCAQFDKVADGFAAALEELRRAAA